MTLSWRSCDTNRISVLILILLCFGSGSEPTAREDRQRWNALMDGKWIFVGRGYAYLPAAHSEQESHDILISSLVHCDW